MFLLDQCMDEAVTDIHSRHTEEYSLYELMEYLYTQHLAHRYNYRSESIRIRARSETRPLIPPRSDDEAQLRRILNYVECGLSMKPIEKGYVPYEFLVFEANMAHYSPIRTRNLTPVLTELVLLELMHRRHLKRIQLNLRFESRMPRYSSVAQRFIEGNDEGFILLWERRYHTNGISVRVY
ncbi:MAG: hypothetical protein OXC80_00930 [Gammaproteobacteria bacterium]|nr:hypothetical protein [Gammaproteobacteria bacterium]